MKPFYLKPIKNTKMDWAGAVWGVGGAIAIIALMLHILNPFIVILLAPAVFMSIETARACIEEEE